MHVFNDHSELIKLLTSDICSIIESAIQKKGKAHLLLSGGSTPIPLYKSLASCDLDWDNIHIGLVDERMVDQSSEFSNETLIRVAFKSAHTLHLSSMVLDLSDPIKNLVQVSKNYAPFIEADLVLLGMGDDGHTASLFPNDIDSELAMQDNDSGICYTSAPNQPIKRITCNRSMLINSSQLFLYFTGLKKLDKFKLAKQERTPIFHFENQLSAVYFTENT